ncbi:hypothetical protein MTsPCn5_14760 [Croceitalea sp. MTPC5]|uniref:histidine kinase dimerization/phosphoacceptor domain -containing protein n=1 Tax=Croceitalea sp. MTPC5 TaxID=3056565 RepID=UPI002B3DDD3F|nr:hypothetical protein MTsPCn5_14760 [Croceitalea sp. MTPC5]
MLFLLFTLTTHVQSQMTTRDSLKSVLAGDLVDSVRINAMILLGKTYYPKQMDSFLYHGNALLDFGEKTRSKKAKAEALHLFALADRKQKAYRNAVKNDSSALHIFKDINDTMGHSRMLKSIAKTYDTEKDYDKSAAYYAKALDLAKSLPDPNWVLKIAIDHGIVLSKLSKFDEAFKTLTTESELVKRDDIDLELKIRYHTVLMVLHRYLNENTKAIFYAEKAYQFSKASKFHDNHLTLIINLWDLYRLEGDSKTSQKYGEEAIAFFEKHPIERLEYHINYNGARMFVEKREYDKAEIFYLKNLSLVKAKKDSTSVAQAYTDLGEFYVEINQYAKGRRALKNAESLLQNVLLDTQGMVMRYQIYEYLSSVDSALGDATSSLYHYKRYVAFRDSLKIKEQKQHMVEMELAYESDKKDREIRLLSTKNEVQRLKAGQDRNLRIGLIIGGALALLLLGVTYGKYRTKNRVLTTIAQQKAAIEEKSRENEMLVREIHHRVKNNLQITSSLLNAHTHSSKHDERVNQIIQESQNRIRSMALIHQNLYSSNNFSKVETTSYFNNLIENFRQSYARAHKYVRFKSEIQPGEIKMDLAVPLGLMLNELVTNAFKYAFREPRMDATITIDFKMGPEGESFDLKVSDNGSGMPDGFDMDASGSFGLQMVRGLVAQLKGNIDLEQTNDQGTCFHISVNYSRAA